MSAFDGISLGGGGALPKRTRELQQEASSLLPPSSSSSSQPPLDSPLATVQEHSSSPSSVSQTSSLHSAQLAFAQRPRAGTLPSSFLPSVAPNSRLSDTFLRPPLGSSGVASLPGSGPTTPPDHPFASAILPPAVPSSTPHSRLRSGSLTLLPGLSSSAFGPSVFSTPDWTPHATTTNHNRDSSGEQSAPSLRGSTAAAAMEDSRSPDGSAYGDDQHVKTLDYLGLAEEASTGGGGGSFGSNSLSGATSSTLVPPVAPTMQRLGSTGSMPPTPPTNQLSDFSLQHSRLRSNTVATFPRSSPVGDPLLRSYHQPSPSLSSVVGGPTSSTPLTSDDMHHSSGASPFHRSTPSADSGRLLYATASVLPSPDEHGNTPPPAPFVGLRDPAGDNGANGHDLPGRGRAATIGILDEGKDNYLRRRAGTTVGIPPRHLGVGAGDGPGPAASMANRMGRLGISEDQPHNPTWPGSSRPRTPEGAGAISLTPPLQQPTRSLWVGNLDPKTSPAELQAVFAPYGAIESLRLIPEKECGFVNFVSIADAMRAKEDVLNRLGGQLTKTSGLVRIGYGKAESTPAPTAPGLVHPRSTAGGMVLASSADLNLQTQPTRALWVGSIPSTTTPNHLLAIFSSFGPIESARVLTHKSCGFVNFERLDDAVAARKALNGREILGAEVGAVRIGYAKVPTKVLNGPFVKHVSGDGTPANSSMLGTYPQVYGALQQLSGVSGVPVERQMADGQLQDYRSNMLVGVVSNGHYASAHAFANQAQLQQQQALAAGGAAGGSNDGYLSPFAQQGPTVETVKGSVNEMQLLMRELSQGEDDVEQDVAAVSKDREPAVYYTSIPLAVMNDPRWARRYTQNDAPRLREIRKRLDAEPPVEEIDGMVHELLDEVVALSSDYIGNTIVQKLFEQCSTSARKAMLERVAPHLAPIGTHKNGTWAVQKIIQCVRDEDEHALIEQSLRPYTPPLLLNDFGNYVVQGALRFGSPFADFVFDAMVDRIWEIGSGRFGARSTRQTLENPQSPRAQVKRVAAAIILNAIPLATSSNGALLVTWLLESSNLPQRYALLAPRFAPHLSHLCTHKLASQSVMRVVNQREDAHAQNILLDALLDPEAKTLEDILGDQMHGVSAISKVIASTFLSDERRSQIHDRINGAIEALKVSAVPAYRKLIEDAGGVYSGPPASGTTPPFTPGLPSHSPTMRGAASPPFPQYPTAFPSTPGPHNRRGPPAPHHQHPHPQQHQQQQPFFPQPPHMYPGGFLPCAPPSFGSPYASYPSSPYAYPAGGPPQFSPNLSPPFPATSPGVSHRGVPSTSPAISPLVTHAHAPGAGNPSSIPFSPLSPGGYLPSISSPDPFGALRVGTTDGSYGFSPAFPLSPPPPFTFGGGPSFGMQQQQDGGPSFGDFARATNGH
ncbi:hypothetical protein JCM11641_003789 [Rhodosporidiobolus odoratus]